MEQMTYSAKWGTWNPDLAEHCSLHFVRQFLVHRAFLNKLLIFSCTSRFWKNILKEMILERKDFPWKDLSGIISFMYLSWGMGDENKNDPERRIIFERTNAKGLTSGRSRPRQNIKKSIGKQLSRHWKKHSPKPYKTWGILIILEPISQKELQNHWNPVCLQAFCDATSRCWKPLIFRGKTCISGHGKMQSRNPYKICRSLMILKHPSQKHTKMHQ